MAFPVAIQMYSLREAAKSNLYGTLKQVKAMGYDGVEFAGLYGHTGEEIREMLDDIGLTAISAHVPYRTMEEDPDVFKTYAAIGCQYVAVPHISADKLAGHENYDKFIADLKVFCQKAKDEGMTMLYHNHDFEFETCGGKYCLEHMYDDVPAALLQAELDTCWINVGGEEPSGYVRKFAGRLPVLHLKDFWGEKTEGMYELIGVEKKPVRPEGFEFRPVGYGKQDFVSILEAAKDAGVQWVVVEQDHPSMGLNPLECAKKSIDYIRTINH